MKKKEIKEKLKSLGLSKASKFVCSLACYCIRLQTTPENEDDINIGESKIGGHPDLPDDVEWPSLNRKFLSFLVQINLKDLYDFEKCEGLPKSGWLHFFYDFDSHYSELDAEEKKMWKVIYTDSATVKLSRRNLPDINRNEPVIYNPCRVSFYKAVSLPNWEIVHCNVTSLGDKDVEKYDEFLDFMLEFDPCKEKHQIFGFPVEIQGDMRCECEIYSRGLDYNKVHTLEQSQIEEIEQNAAQWCLLFQMDSDDNADMMWIDCGRLYFWIKEEDFTKHNFENVWMILQCY